MPSWPATAEPVAGKLTALEKSRRAAAHPDRPGERCHAPAGTWLPLVDPNRCEAKGDCVEVCPHDVFLVGPIDPSAYATLGLLGKLRNRAHGGRTATTPGATDCRACGLCVVACPEGAITLRPPPEPPTIGP